jgi:hypothetical protein
MKEVSIGELLQEGKLLEAAKKCKEKLELLAGNRKTREHFQKTADNPHCIYTFTQ